MRESPDMSLLNKDERAALRAFESWTQDHGCAPGVRDLASVLGVHATTAAGRLRKLEVAGLLRRKPGGRSFVLTAGPTAAARPDAAVPEATSNEFGGWALAGSWAGNAHVTRIDVLDDEMAEDGVLAGDVALVVGDAPARPTDIVGVRLNGGVPVIRCVTINGAVAGVFGRRGVPAVVLPVSAVIVLGRLVAVLR
jgi:SOS-response transcriptional repressor LexA